MADRPGSAAPIVAWIVAALIGLLAVPTMAVEPDEVLADPALEGRARVIGKDLRCLVCQNQSIDDSDAELARDLRLLVRERLKAGDSDEEVVRYVVARYGNFVLLTPPLETATLALWFGPAAFLAIALVAMALFFRRRRAVPPTEARPLSESERRRLDALLRDGEP